MKARSVIVYTVLRLLVFLVPFGLLMLLPIGRQFAWLSAIFAALIGLSLSIIFLRRPLAAATEGLGARRRDEARADTEAEDAADDAARSEGASEPGRSAGQ